MCLSYLSVLSLFLFSCKNVFFSKGWGEVYKWDLLFYLLLLFLKNALLPLLFHSKMSFTCKNPEFFPRSLEINKLTNDFFQGVRCKTSIFLVLTPKGSLYRYYPTYLVWNLFRTTHCDKFCTWKSPTIPTFLHQ